MRVLSTIARRIAWGAGAALFVILLLSLARHPSVPAAVAAVSFALAMFAAARPAAALTASALLIPVASWIGRTWHYGIAWPEVVAVAFLAGYAIRQTFVSPRAAADGLVIAIHTTIALIAASLGVELLVLHGTAGSDSVIALLRELSAGEYFVGTGGFEGGDAAMRLVEGLLLAHAGISVVSLDPERWRSLVRAIVIGAAAAGALNLWDLWVAALRLESPASSFVRYLATLRFNTHYPDVNAAGSYFAMALLPAGASILAAGWRWIPAAVLITISLVLSGSRAAILAAAAAAMWAWWMARRRHARPAATGIRSTLLMAVPVIVACAAASFFLLQRNETAASTALNVRAEFARISIDMLTSRPLFGIGVGQYPARLHEFASPALKALYPVERENAHNNFLQILAELGVLGFAGFVGVLAIAASRMRPLLTTGPLRTLQIATIAGLLAFVVTWLAGHPLLLDAPALTFWLLLGATAGWGMVNGNRGIETGDAARTPAQSEWKRWVSAALMVALLTSIPLRARKEAGAANLEHLGIGVSQWQPDVDGVRYRFAGVTSTVFIPADADAIDVPLRAVQPDTRLHVEVFLDGRLANVLDVPADRWMELTIQVPRRDDGKRFRALELRVRDASADDGRLLMVGKVRPRWSHVDARETR